MPTTDGMGSGRARRLKARATFSRSGSGEFRDGSFERGGDLRDFLLAEREGRGEEDVIAGGAVDATLDGIYGDVLLVGEFANALGHAGGWGERSVRYGALHKFHSQQQAAAADVADEGRGGEGF